MGISINNKKNNLILWGAGKVGKEILAFLRLHGIEPLFFCDSNKDKIGTFCDGLEIIDHRSIDKYDNATVILSLYNYGDLLKKIEDEKLMSEHRIIVAPSILSYELLLFIYKYKANNDLMVGRNSGDCVFDFTYGTELGGVQTWVYDQRIALEELGISSKYLMPDNRKKNCSTPECVEVVSANKYTRFDLYIDAYVSYLVKSDYSTIVINFPREIMTASMIVKMLYRPDIMIVAVIHSDDEIYYESYGKFKNLIDEWFVISERIENRVRELGVASEKIHKLQWKLIVDNNSVIEDNSLTKIGKIRIGFAGRIVIPAKRIDLIIELADLLREKIEDFELIIAGSGESQALLEEEIINKKLGNYVKYIGEVKHKDIWQFWQTKDIYISCSDYEGHSITQVEAMIMGAVPVVTDVSGARDDIADGINGYVLPIGDVKGIAEKIVYLDNHRDILSAMSEKNKTDMRIRNESVDYKTIWAETLERK